MDDPWQSQTYIDRGRYYGLPTAVRLYATSPHLKLLTLLGLVTTPSTTTHLKSSSLLVLVALKTASLPPGSTVWSKSSHVPHFCYSPPTPWAAAAPSSGRQLPKVSLCTSSTSSYAPTHPSQAHHLPPSPTLLLPAYFFSLPPSNSAGAHVHGFISQRSPAHVCGP